MFAVVTPLGTTSTLGSSRVLMFKTPSTSALFMAPSWCPCAAQLQLVPQPGANLARPAPYLNGPTAGVRIGVAGHQKRCAGTTARNPLITFPGQRLKALTARRVQNAGAEARQSSRQSRQ